jgi:hypothetical protein
MRTWRSWPLTALLAVAVSTATVDAQQPPPGAPDAARLAAAKRALQASGSVDVMIAAMRANLPAQKAALPQVPDEFWTRFEARIEQDAPVLLDSIAVLYAQTFTTAELEAFTAFYQSPAGRRLKAKQPSIVAQSSAIGQRWGSRIGAEIGAALERP